MKVALLQLNAGQDKAANLAKVAALVDELMREQRPDLIVLPEMFSFIGGDQEARIKNAEDFSQSKPGDAAVFLSDLAAKYQVAIHGGSICEQTSQGFFNTTLVFDRSGAQIAKYRKIHLFEFQHDDAAYREADFYQAGQDLVAYSYMGVRLGCSICFDLRFPSVYQGLRELGASIMVAPAAFIKTTGELHWELLCRTRAVETQSYMLAVNQTGSYTVPGGTREIYGHSMIIDPMGRILQQLAFEEGYLVADLDLAETSAIRQRLPMQSRYRILANSF